MAYIFILTFELHLEDKKIIITLYIQRDIWLQRTRNNNNKVADGQNNELSERKVTL